MDIIIKAGQQFLGIFRSPLFCLTLIFGLFLSHFSKSQEADSIQNQSVNQDTIQNSADPGISGDSTGSKSAVPIKGFIEQIQESAANEYVSSVQKFENRKIYLRQHDLLNSLKDENYRIKRIITKGFDYREIKAKINEFQSLMAATLSGINESDKELQTERNLTVSAAIFREMLDQLAVKKNVVDEFADQIRRSQYVIDSISAEKDLYLFSDDSLETRQYAYLLIEISKETKPIDDSLKNLSNLVDSLQTSLNEMVFDLNTQIETLELTRKELNASIFSQEIPEELNSSYFKRSITEAISYSILKEKIALFFYFNLYIPRFVLLVVLILTVWLFLRNVKARYIQNQTSTDIDENSVVLKSPLLSAIVIVSGIFQFFFPSPPFVVYWIIWFISSISLTIIFSGYLVRFWMFFWVFTVVVFLLSGSVNMILLPSQEERILMIILSSIGVLFLVFTIWRGRNKQLKEKRIVYFIWFMGVFEFFSLALNLMGRFNLSKSFLVAGFIGIVVGILLLWTVRLINQGLSLANKVYHGQEKDLFFINFDKLGEKAPGIFYAFIVLGWTILIGKNFYTFSQISISINEFLNAERMIGSYKFSINGIFVFIIILLVSVLISRLLSIFSADPDPASTTDQRKRVSFGSWLLLVQIFVISTGLFLAFAASGIPLDKITIILGALSVGIGLGLQSLVNNLVSGLIIAFENTVKVGDLIEIEGKPGIMKSIGFRSSVVNMFEGSTVVIPNGDLIAKQLINWTTGKGRKLTLIIGVAYGSDLAKVTHILREIISEDTRIRLYPAARVVPVEFADSSIDIEVTFWVNNYNDFPFVKGEFISRANELFQQNGIKIPFPQRDLYLKKLPKKDEKEGSEADSFNPNG
ncbi:mechanosensitive ion channel family protein [Algoriphagus litoralis]|uniref:mechanosensitive ion channel family protein n=1 Tax=Algoriphagus litoralis TaxID=2202829 RepID=UPI0013005586|nr:mechanosensitive ion channel domain-containing protein [Algoriphagus litoralis]